MSGQLVKELLKSALASSLHEEREPVDREAIAADLQKKLELLNVKHDFQVGQLVQHKNGLNHKKHPVGNVAIVSKLLPTPIIDNSQEAGSAYFQEQLDIVVLQIGVTGDAIEYHLDSRRLEPYVETEVIQQPLN